MELPSICEQWHYTVHGSKAYFIFFLSPRLSLSLSLILFSFFSFSFSFSASLSLIWPCFHQGPLSGQGGGWVWGWGFDFLSPVRAERLVWWFWFGWSRCCSVVLSCRHTLGSVLVGPVRRPCAVVLVPVRAILVQQLGSVAAQMLFRLVWFWLVLVLFGDFCWFEWILQVEVSRCGVLCCFWHGDRFYLVFLVKISLKL